MDSATSIEKVDLLAHLLDLIGENCRNLWRLIFFDELTYKEIAQKLGISEAAVKVRAFRCKEEARVIRKSIE